MSKAVKFCSIILSIILLIPCLHLKAEGQTATINGTNINIRAEASTSSSSLFKGNFDNVTVYILNKAQNQGEPYPWYRIQYGDIVGYMYGDPSWFTLNTTTPETPAPETPVNPDAEKTFEESLADFPESYHSYLRALHATYPNWKFVADKLEMSFDEAVQNEYIVTMYYNSKGEPIYTCRSMVEVSQGIAWRSLQKLAYDWATNKWQVFDSDRWVASSREVVAYYMDPRNFLNDTYVYMFLKQSYDPSMQNEDGLNSIIANTFLALPYEYNASHQIDKLYEGSYAKVLMAAAEKSNINPYVLAAKILTEIGKQNPSQIVSGAYPGYEGYYNFFNWGASGSNPVAAGLETAKKEAWDSRASAILGGAQKLANGYVNDKQDTYYYMDFNVIKKPYYTHQYAAAAYDAYNKAYNLSITYKDYTSAPLVFSIPVYTSIPDALATKPAAKDDRYNNYYLTSMTAEGLTTPFDMYTNNYTMNISDSTTVYVKTPAGASIVSALSNSIAPGTNTVKITVKSETGYTRDYVLTVISEKPCTLTVTTDDPPTPPESGDSNPDNPNPDTPPDNPNPPPTPEPPTPTIMKGDTNGDGKISLTDVANVQKHLLGIITLTDDAYKAADTNGDGRISLTDVANVQKHLLGIIQLS